jgi:hypothetical protein
MPLPPRTPEVQARLDKQSFDNRMRMRAEKAEDDAAARFGWTPAMRHPGETQPQYVARREEYVAMQKEKAAERAAKMATHEGRLAHLQQSRDEALKQLEIQNTRSDANLKRHLSQEVARFDREIREEMKAEEERKAGKAASLAAREKELEGLFGGKNRKSRKSRVRKTRAMRKRKTTRRRS